MNYAGATSGVPSQTANTDLERRWPAMTVFVTAWLLPATTARRTGHVHLPDAWVIHLLALVLTVLLIMLLVALVNGNGIAKQPELMFDEFGSIINTMVDEFKRHPYVFPATLAGITISIEIGFLLLALLVMPWGASDEPMRESYRNALRHTWLHTGRLVPYVALVGAVGLLLYHIDGEWWRDRVMYYPWTHPWYQEYFRAFVVQTAFIGVLWLLWGLFRAVGASRHTPLIERPPLCEACGYNLSTIPMESRCPECGEAVETSLGPAARPGTVWQRGHKLGCWTAWWRCSVMAVRLFRLLGRQLRVVSPGTYHRRFFALHLPVVFCIGAMGFAGFVVAAAGVDELVDEPAFALMFMSMFGVCVRGWHCCVCQFRCCSCRCS